MNHVYILYNQPYLNKFTGCYQNIITINKYPYGNLSRLVKKIQFPILSSFQEFNQCNNRVKCGYAISSNCNPCQLMTVEEIPELFSFLISNNYEIDTKLTKMMVNGNTNFLNTNEGEIICFITIKS